MAQLVKLTAYALNGTALPNPLDIAFPTASIIAVELDPAISINGTTCNSKVYVIGTNDAYYTDSTVQQIKNEDTADVTLTFDMPDTSINGVTLRFFCNGTQIHYLYTPQDSADITDVINILNGTFNVLGTFSNPSGSIVQLVMSSDMKSSICPVGTLTFDVVAD